jgi:hypothetical protein
MAHEGLGYGTWSNCNEDIPTVDADCKLAILDVSNSKHPKLKSKEMEYMEMSVQEEKVVLETKHSSSTTRDVPKKLTREDTEITYVSIDS